MKIKIVESIEDYNDNLNKQIRKGTLKEVENGILLTPETFSKVFSPERIKLLQRIYKNHIKSIYQLAKELDKPYEVVFRNIKYLEGLGLIKITEYRNKKIPSVNNNYDIDFFAQEKAMV
jgi:predicted transcriptional regulator